MAVTATGARHSLDYIAEVTYGTTPATPGFSDVRHTGCTLGVSKSSFESAEVRDDRQIAHFRHGNVSVAGDIPFELSHTSFDDLIEAVMGGTWATDVLKSGTTRRSFTFERKFANIATPEYHRYTGAEINTMSVSIAPDSIVTGSFGVIGQAYANATAIISGATYGAAGTTEPMDSFSGSITEGGSAIATVTSIDFTIENGLSPLFVVGSDETLQPSIGKSRVTGTLTAFFQDKSLLDKFINETSSEIVVVVSDPASNTLQFDFPNIVYTGGQPDVDGEGEISISLPFTALYNSSDASQLVITRS